MNVEKQSTAIQAVRKKKRTLNTLTDAHHSSVYRHLLGTRTFYFIPKPPLNSTMQLWHPAPPSLFS